MGIVFFVAYLIFVAVLSIMGAKKVKSMKTYAIGNREMGPVLCAIVWAAAMSSAGSFIGVTGQFYANGLSVLWYHLALAFCIPLGFAFFGKGYRRISMKKTSISVPDWVADRYGSEFLRVFLGITAVLQISYIASQFVGMGVILQSIFGIPYLLAALLGIAVVASYVFAGGTYSHIFTNILQGILMLLAACFIFSIGFRYFPNLFGDLYQSLEKIDPKLVQRFNPNDVAFNSPFAVAGIFIAHLLWGLNPHQVNKVQYLKTDRDLRKFFILCMVFCVTLSLCTWAGMYARVLVPGLERADQASVRLIGFVYSPLFAAVFYTVFIAAAMSTTDGLLVYLSSVAGNTLYKNCYLGAKKRRGETVDEGRADSVALKISRWTVPGLCILALPFVVVQPKFMNVLQWIGNGGVLSSFVGPILFGIYSRKASKQAAVISSVTGFFGYCIIYLGGIVKSVYAATACGMVLGIVTMGIATLCTKPMPTEESAQWFVDETTTDLAS
jgi:Na+/proline symporter